MDFKSITLDNINSLLPYIKMQDYRTCDFTLGGIYMWADYFDYKYAISNDMLILKGKAEVETDLTAFTVPVGFGDMNKALIDVEYYAKEQKIPLVFSAVPEKGKDLLENYYNCEIEKLDNWEDYLYKSSDIVNLLGHNYTEKRNHINKFKKTYGTYEYHNIDSSNIEKVKDFLNHYHKDHPAILSLYQTEIEITKKILNELESLKFLGGYIENQGKIVAFSIGEKICDTLFIHIEKAYRDIYGAYDIINMEFAKNNCTEEIQYVNREEDVGDPGLRQAKESYHPITKLSKYNVKIINRK